MSNMYKIVNPTGMYSTGGTRPRFTKTGKIWRIESHLKSHLRILYGRDVYKGCKVVVLKVEEEETFPIDEALEAIDKWKAEQKRLKAQRSEKYRKELRRKQYEELRAEFEGSDG